MQTNIRRNNFSSNGVLLDESPKKKPMMANGKAKMV
jgi:hypothetical protein